MKHFFVLLAIAFHPRASRRRLSTRRRRIIATHCEPQNLAAFAACHKRLSARLFPSSTRVCHKIFSLKSERRNSTTFFAAHHHQLVLTSLSFICARARAPLVCVRLLTSRGVKRSARERRKRLIKFIDGRRCIECSSSPSPSPALVIGESADGKKKKLATRARASTEIATRIFFSARAQLIDAAACTTLCYERKSSLNIAMRARASTR